jgi:hypothetical protein
MVVLSNMNLTTLLLLIIIAILLWPWVLRLLEAIFTVVSCVLLGGFALTTYILINPITLTIIVLFLVLAGAEQAYIHLVPQAAKQQMIEQIGVDLQTREQEMQRERLSQESKARSLGWEPTAKWYHEHPDMPQFYLDNPTVPPSEIVLREIKRRNPSLEN